MSLLLPANLINVMTHDGSMDGAPSGLEYVPVLLASDRLTDFRCDRLDDWRGYVEFAQSQATGREFKGGLLGHEYFGGVTAEHAVR